MRSSCRSTWHVPHAVGRRTPTAPARTGVSIAGDRWSRSRRAEAAAHAMKTVAVAAMGGDHAPEAVIEGAIDAARELSIPVTLVGDRERITRELNRHRVGDLPIHVHHASQVVEMDDSPVEALRRKRDSSIRVGFQLVKTGDADAFVGAGNSGAMMAAGVMLLGNLPGVDRPAIALELPSRRGHVTLLDAGANVECAPLNLVQVAVMGDVFGRSGRGLLSPR